MLKKIFLVITIIVLAALGISFFQEYMINHTYYDQMRASMENRKIVGAGIVFALFPTVYILWAKKGTFWWLFGASLVWLMFFMGTYLSIKGGLNGWLMKLLLNVTVLFSLGVGMLVTFTTLGGIIKERLLGLTTTTIFGVVLNLGLGLCAFILLNHVLIMLNVFYPIVSWLMFAGAGYLIRRYQDTLKKYRHIIRQTCLPLQRSTVLMVGMGILLVLAFVYFYNGFSLALIPYSTAWDANHAYMFHPKMRALNHGYYWDVPDMLVPPQVWYSFISYRFSLFAPFKAFLGLSADTYAIQMNFRSGVFVLIFGWSAVSEVLAYIRSYNEKQGKSHVFNSDLVFFIGALLRLLRLSSGMGAFLVFIDNKTDLGILALILLAVYSWFYFLRLLVEHNEETQKHIRIYVALSWFFYAFAVLAKPTALFDVANFWLFLWGAWFGLLGVVGVFLVLVWAMGAIKFRGVNEYLTSMVGMIVGGVGAWATLIDIFGVMWKRTRTMTRYMLLWIWSFFVVFLAIKLPVEIAREIVDGSSFNFRGFVERTLLTSASPGEKAPAEETAEKKSGLAVHDRLPLFAQANANPGMLQNTCTLASQWFTTPEDLYKNLQEGHGDSFSEDVGRYVGYGWKWWTTDQRRGIPPFIDSRWTFMLSPGCHTFSLTPWDKTAKTLCETEGKWRSNDPAQLREVQSQVPEGERAHELLGKLIDLSSQGGAGAIITEQTDAINALDTLMQNESIRVLQENGQKIVFFPYKYLNIFNITFNRSLQNLSSYYTDIGVVWLLLIFSTVLGLIYGLLRGHRLLSVASLVTLCGWLLRWFIGGGILWYGIGIIAWTIIAFVIYLTYLLGEEDDVNRALSMILLFVFGVICVYQMSLNLVRIASQGGGGAFLRYKTNAGVREEYDDQLKRVSKMVTNYNANDVFNLQFPQYNKIIKLANERGEEDGMLIAGTYLRYFINDQHYIRGDGFLEWMRKMFSDSDPCNGYLRLKDNHLRYIVIDPNIGTVVQGGGNQTLFDRFFARLSPTDGSLVEHGALSMLVRLQQEGYIRYVSSNNLGAKYAFLMPDSVFGPTEQKDQITLAKARMAAARFRWQNNTYINLAVTIAEQRMKTGEFIDDLADLIGKQIDTNKLIEVAKKAQITQEDIKLMTQDERVVFGQFLGLMQLAKQNPEQFHQQMVNIINSSIGAGSQLIVLEVL